jgi:hypothetical protein
MKSLRILGLSLVLVVCAITSRAQEVLYTQYEKFDPRVDEFSVVGKVGDRTYMFHSQGKDFFLEAYNDNMDKLATVMLDFFPTKIYETRFVASASQITVLYQALSGNKVIQYAAILDDKGRLKKGPISLGEEKTGLLGPTKDYYESAVSEDKKVIAVYKFYAKGGTISIEGKCIDQDLNVTKRFKAMHKTDNNMEHGDVIVSNDGMIYLPVFTPIGSRNYADELSLLCLNTAIGTGNKFVAKELPLNGMYASRVYIKIDNTNNRVYVGGFYSGKKNGNFDGVLYAYYDIATGTFENKKFIGFDTDIQGATGERNASRAFNDFQIKQLIIKNDGGFVMVSEESYVAMRSSYAPGFGYYSMYYPMGGMGGGQNIREYYYNDILALSYNAEGVRDWYSFVRKRQYSQEDNGRFSSYAFLNSGASLGFLFNDYDAKNSRIQLATVDNDGKADMRSFTADGNENPDWLPRFGKQVSTREIVVPCLRKKQICFAKVVF